MTNADILKALKSILAGSHQMTQIGVENALSRLILRLERDEKELDDEWDSLMRGVTLTSLDVDLTYRLVRE